MEILSLSLSLSLSLPLSLSLLSLRVRVRACVLHTRSPEQVVEWPVNLILKIYRTFVIEEEFGFNKHTWKSFGACSKIIA